MSGCCGEYNCRRKHPMAVGHSGLTDRWYVITRYKAHENGMIEAYTKHDVTDQLRATLIREGWTPPAEAEP